MARGEGQHSEQNKAPCPPGERVIVIGIGNEFRTDDAIGLLVARELRSMVPEAVTVVEHSGEGAGLIDILRGAGRAVLLDAVQSDDPAGTVHRIDLGRDEIPISLNPRSSHAFGVAEAVKMARALHEIPPSIHMYGVTGQSFDFGTSVTAPVRDQILPLAARLRDELVPVDS